MTTNIIGTRIKALREERKLSQDDLARLFGFKDRQTVSAIENGERRVSAGNPECAIHNLRLALNEGFTNARKIASDESFASIRDLPGFQQLIASQTAQ